MSASIVSVIGTSRNSWYCLCRLFFLFLLIFVPRYVNNVDLFSRSSVTYLLIFFSNSERIILLFNERFFHESFVYLSELAQGAGKQTFLLTLTKKTNKQTKTFNSKSKNKLGKSLYYLHRSHRWI